MDLNRAGPLPDPALAADRLRRLVREFLHPHRATVAWALVGLLIQSSLMLPIPVLQGVVIDHLVGLARRTATPSATDQAQAFRLIVGVLVASIACHLGRMALSWSVARSIGRASQELVVALRGALQRKFMRLPLAYFDAQQTGRLMARVTSDVGSILVFFNSGSLQLANDLILGLGVASVMLWLQWRLALAAFLVLPIYAINHRFFARRVHQLSLAIRAQIASIYALLSERISAVRVVRSFAQEDGELGELDRQVDLHRGLNLQNLDTSAALNALATLVSGMGTLLVLAYGITLIRHGRLTVGELMAFYALIAQLYLPIVRLTQFGITATATRIAVQRLYEIFDEPEPISDRPGARPVVAPRGELTFDDVTFAYDSSSEPTLDRLSLRVEAGSTLGIIGPSGAGKSTLVALAARLYDVAEGAGAVRFDGVDVRDLRLASLRRAVALVPQQAMLFEGTIRSNLVYAHPEASEAQIGWAIEAADLARTVAALPDGLETAVGERGQSLSGGQRQRLALARALIADPALLLIDDGTSALDAETEARVRQALRSGRPGRTMVIVSHKVASIRHADRIAVMQDGRITETGTHADLIQRGGYYAQTYRHQNQPLERPLPPARMTSAP